MRCKIYLDLDGVFADLFRVVRLLLGREFDASPDTWKILEQVPHLFRDLPMLPDARRLWVGLAPYAEHLEVLTALPLPTGQFVTADADKRVWVAQNLSPALPVNTIVGGVNKVAFVQPGAVLIDDLARNIELWRAAGGLGILHTDAPSTLLRLQQILACR